MDTAVGLGIAVIFVLTITSPVNWFIHNYILREGALKWMGEEYATLNMSYLRLIFFIGVIAAMVQIVEMAIDKFSPKLYTALGIFLPLIAVNCAILGTSMFLVEREYSLVVKWKALQTDIPQKDLWTFNRPAVPSAMPAMTSAPTSTATAMTYMDRGRE